LFEGLVVAGLVEERPPPHRPIENVVNVAARGAAQASRHELRLAAVTHHVKKKDSRPLFFSWAHLLAYNLLRTLIAQAAVVAQLRPGEIPTPFLLVIWRAFRSPLAASHPQAFPWPGEVSLANPPVSHSRASLP